MKRNLFSFDVPQLNNRFDRVEVMSLLEELAMCAFYIAGDDQMGLKEMVEIIDESTIEEYNPEGVYGESLNELYEIIDGYNFYVNSNKSSMPQIQLVVDNEKTSLLKDSSQFQVYKVVMCDGLK